jgi:flagellar basal body rod protein FlgG
MKYVVLCLLITILCCNSNSLKEKELELKEKELILKEKELEIGQENNKKTRTESVDKKKPNVVLFNDIEYLYGTWINIKNRDCKIRYTRDGRFVFIDMVNEIEEELVGNYVLKNGKISMLYDDRHQQVFLFAKDETIKNNKIYIVLNNKYIFEKSN